MKRYPLTILLTLFGSFSSAHAQSGLAENAYPVYSSPRDIPAATFAKGQRIYGIQMSPSGQHAVAFYLVGDSFQLRLIEIDEARSNDINKLRVRAPDLRQVVWIDEDSVVIEQRRDIYIASSLSFNASHTITSFSRASDRVKSVINIRHLSGKSYAMNTIVHALPEKAGQFLLSYSPDGESYPGVYLIDIHTGESETVVPPTPPFKGWWADADGIVRFGLAVEGEKLRMIVRTGESDTWRELENDQLVSTQRVRPVLVEPGGKTMIVMSALNQGRYGLYRISLETGQMIEKLFEHPVVDVQSITIANSDQRLLSAEYITDRLGHHYFDKSYGELIEAFEKVLPDRSISVLQTSMDDRFVLFFASNEIYPGAYYRFDQQTNELLLLDEIRADINPAEMSRSVKMTYFARDGLEIDGYLTVPQGEMTGTYPTVIMPHSNPGERDSLKFDYFVQFLASRGYAVFQPNYRGSSGYGYVFSTLAREGWGMEMQEDLADAATFLIDEGISESGQICLTGRNYAGYAALLGVIRDPDIFACAIAISPITDLPGWVKLVRKNFGEYAADAISGERNKRALKKSSPLHLVKDLTRPVLIVHGSADQAIPYDQSVQFVKKMETHESEFSSLGLPGGDNNLSDTRMKTIVFERMELFLGKHLSPVTEAVIEE